MMQAWREGRDMHHYLHDVEVVTQLDSAGKHPEAWPQFNMDFLHAFRKEYPFAWIILHTRIPKNAVHSLRRWGLCSPEVTKVTPGIKPSSTNTDIERWMNDYYFKVRNEFHDDQRFLDIRIEGDPRKKLAEAFKREFPWWGIENEKPWKNTENTENTEKN